MPSISEQLRLLGDPTRLRILHLLAVEPLTVAELQDVLELSQSSVSGHLGRLKRAGFIHDHAEGSSHRYRLREDLDQALATTWETVRGLSQGEGDVLADMQRLEQLREQRQSSWVERVAGSLHREYAPGRTWESLVHGFVHFIDFGRCVDVGAGDGSMIELLAPHTRELICVDPAPAMVQAGENWIAERRMNAVRYVQAGAEQLPLEDNSCDSALFLQSLQYVPEPARALAEAVRVLAPGGRLMVLTLLRHHHAEAERYGHLHHGFSARQLRSWAGELDAMVCYELAPESRSPRFQSLLLSGRKRG